MSVAALLWLTLRMTGIAGLPEFVSPSPPPEGVPPGRNTVVKNVTGAASTGFGGDEESVTRTMAGWNAWPADTCPAPATGCRFCCESGTGLM